MNSAKQYSHRQFESMLMHQTRSLRLLNESCSAAVDRLVQDFGHDRVFSTWYDYVLTQADLKKMFIALNDTLFGKKLKLIRIEYWDEDRIVDKLNEYDIESGSDATRVSADFYGVFAAVNKTVNRTDGTTVNVSFQKPMIMLNRSLLTACLFIFAVACLCHEMIHYYDHFSGEYVSKFIEYCNTNKKFNSHLDKVFQEKMKEANNAGIDVVEDYGPVNTFQNVNNKARYKLFRIVGEDDDECGIVARFDGHTLAVTNKNTGNGFFAMFD